MIRASIENNIVICDYLEIPVSFGCNLSCDNCSHYSNYKHKGFLSIEDCELYVNSWINKIHPKKINILGGEPFMNNNLDKIIELVSKFNTYIYITTNGLLINRQKHILETLLKYNISLNISLHSTNKEYLEKMKDVNIIIKEWIKNGLKVVYNDSITSWSKRYIGYGKNMMPYNDNNQRSSWINCKGRDCVQLYENSLYKCAALAYLKLQKEKFNIDKIWDKYLSYKPLNNNCELIDIVNFYNKEDEFYCNMCPANPVYFIKNITSQ